MQTSRLAVAGAAFALAIGAVPATYLANSAIQQAQAQGRCWGIMTGVDDANRTGAQDVAFLTTFLPTEVEGTPTVVDKDRYMLVMDGQTYYARTQSDLDFLNPGEQVNLAYTLEGGRRWITYVEFLDPDVDERRSLQENNGFDPNDNDRLNDDATNDGSVTS